MRSIPVSDTLSLELIDDRHAAPLFTLLEKNRDHLSEWLPWVSRMKSVDDFEAYITYSKHRYAEKMEAGYVIMEQGKTIGRTGLYHFNHVDKIASIGYWIGKEHEGKGIITGTCRELINLGFSRLGLNRIEIKCATGNQKSRAVPERLGFKLEGTIRQGELVHDKFIDLYLFSLLKSEWMAAR
jgi:ribosomal-protein-serine acetyltransferase